MQPFDVAVAQLLLPSRLITSPRAAAAAVLATVAVAGWALGGGVPGSVGLRRREEHVPCPRPDAWWQALQANLSAEVAAAERGEGWGVVFFGDSLIETLRGTTRGGRCGRCAGVPEVFAKHVGSKYKAAALGIAGDQTSHLLWRLQRGGELPARAAAVRSLRAVVLLIGTNDLGAASDVGEAGIQGAVEGMVDRYEAILKLLLARLPAAQILMLSLLPRGTPNPPGHYASQPSCPGPWGGGGDGGGGAAAPRAKALGPPSLAQPSIFSAALGRANARLRELAARSKRVQWVECGGQLLLAGDGSIDASLMPDALHPSAAGYEALFSGCWAAALARALQ